MARVQDLQVRIANDLADAQDALDELVAARDQLVVLDAFITDAAAKIALLRSDKVMTDVAVVAAVQ